MNIINIIILISQYFKKAFRLLAVLYILLISLGNTVTRWQLILLCSFIVGDYLMQDILSNFAIVPSDGGNDNDALAT